MAVMTTESRAEALFVSCLQPSDSPTPAEVGAAIRDSLRANGGLAGCAAQLAAEYGDHPLEAVDRMRWALELVANSRGGRRRPA
jgi:hypothetical protein